MPQLLPRFPNLEHVKGQAKDVLRVAQRRHPAWRLARAQHAVARGYGFTSWPELKTHVDSLRRHSPAASIQPRGTDAERANGSEHPLEGTWVLNPSRSSMPASQRLHDGVLLEFSVAHGTATMTQVVVDPSGLDIAIRIAIRADGGGQPVRFGKGLVLDARLAGPRRLEAVIRNGEHIVSEGAYEVSPDGRMLVFNTSDTQLVFDRTGGR
jgi:hypothetical protein